MSQNKTGKYIKYAIGEIFLVMIGILLALQVNNWNENKKSEARLDAILKDINTEFIENKKQLAFIKSGHQDCYNSIKKVIALFPINLKTIDLDSLQSNVLNLFANWTFEPKVNRINTLINSSDFNLIDNKALQDLLIFWESIYNDYNEDEQAAIDYNFNQLYPYLEQYFPSDLNLKDPRFNINILESIEFENKMASRFRALRDILENNTNELQVLETTIDKIIELTESAE